MGVNNKNTAKKRKSARNESHASGINEPLIYLHTCTKDQAPSLDNSQQCCQPRLIPSFSKKRKTTEQQTETDQDDCEPIDMKTQNIQDKLCDSVADVGADRQSSPVTKAHNNGTLLVNWESIEDKPREVMNEPREIIAVKTEIIERQSEQEANAEHDCSNILVTVDTVALGELEHAIEKQANVLCPEVVVKNFYNKDKSVKEGSSINEKNNSERSQGYIDIENSFSDSANNKCGDKKYSISKGLAEIGHDTIVTTGAHSNSEQSFSKDGDDRTLSIGDKLCFNVLERSILNDSGIAGCSKLDETIDADLTDFTHSSSDQSKDGIVGLDENMGKKKGVEKIDATLWKNEGAEEIDITLGKNAGAEEIDITQGKKEGAEEIDITRGKNEGEEEIDTTLGKKEGAEKIDITLGKKEGAEEIDITWGKKEGAEEMDTTLEKKEVAEEIDTTWGKKKGEAELYATLGKKEGAEEIDASLGKKKAEELDAILVTKSMAGKLDAKVGSKKGAQELDAILGEENGGKEVDATQEKKWTEELEATLGQEKCAEELDETLGLEHDSPESQTKVINVNIMQPDRCNVVGMVDVDEWSEGNISESDRADLSEKQDSYQELAMDITDSQLCEAVNLQESNSRLQSLERQRRQRLEGRKVLYALTKDMSDLNKQLLRTKREIETAQRKKQSQAFSNKSLVDNKRY